MDVDWALKQLDLYLSLHERVPLPPEEVKPNKKTRLRGSVEERSNAQNSVLAIAEVIDRERPRWAGESLVRRLIWELTEGDEAREKLGAEGDPPPLVEGKSLHPWVWEAARPHWTSGNHDAAVWAAAINVNSRLQRKVNRKEIGEGQLVRESFSPESPKPNVPRLRLCDPSNVSLFKDMHVGAGNFGQGLFSAVRNVVNHVEPDEHSFRDADAIEALAAFSLLARWIERAELETVS
ncbi:TIGR02391 family protein [Glaciibacter psychrotolerans]|uniref:Conserved hypothetical protein CHP02391 domain-containing protein n=1 Tax=Glaciibacter psychrotolerans TaxID=670054 RepID=A0A7Z0ECY8_9MICO|nr:TIGR02391 family protein [Leifsonia psychrotolerans]NYJ18880.1 hypothetical protein [Leifsonia psychrotolerans]